MVSRTSALTQKPWQPATVTRFQKVSTSSCQRRRCASSMHAACGSLASRAFQSSGMGTLPRFWLVGRKANSGPRISAIAKIPISQP